MKSAQVERISPDHIRISGELGAHSIPGLLRDTSGWFAQADSITVDLSDVARADSAGVALLLDWWRQAQSDNTSIRYVNAPRQMRDIIDFCALDNVLPLS